MPEDKNVLTVAFKLPPEKAVKYLENKGYKITENWHDIWEEAHAKAFTVAKMSNLQLLKDTKKILEDSLKNGQGAIKTRKELENLYIKKGWWGREAGAGAGGVDETRTRGTTASAVKTVQLGSKYRVKTIYTQNIQSAYNAGRRLEQLEDADIAPYWQYQAVMDGKTRDSHKALNGKVFRYDNPFWTSFYPPNGWNCRCTVRALTPNQVKRMGLKIEPDKEIKSKEVIVGGDKKSVAEYTFHHDGRKISISPSPGFSYDTAKASWGIDVQAWSKVENLPQKIKDSFISDMANNPHNKKVFDNMIEKLAKNGFKAQRIEKTLSWITPELFKKLNEVEIKTPIVVFQDKRAGHIIGERAKLSKDELKKIYDILNNPDNVYYDYTKGERGTNLAFTKDIPKTDTVTKVCVKLTKKSNISGDVVNYVTTAGKVKKSEMKDTKSFKKIK